MGDERRRETRKGTLRSRTGNVDALLQAFVFAAAEDEWSDHEERPITEQTGVQIYTALVCGARRQIMIDQPSSFNANSFMVGSKA